MRKDTSEPCRGGIRRRELGIKDERTRIQNTGNKDFPCPEIQFHLKYFLMKSEWSKMLSSPERSSGWLAAEEKQELCADDVKNKDYFGK